MCHFRLLCVSGGHVREREKERDGELGLNYLRQIIFLKAS